MSQKNDVEFLESYLKDLEHYYHKILPHLAPWDFVTPERILADVPTKKKMNERLAKSAERLFSKAKKNETKFPRRAKRSRKKAELLSDSDFRSKRAAKLVARKKRLAKLSVKRLEEKIDAANARDGMVARIADENGYDGKLFVNLDDNPTSLQSIRRFGEQIKTLRIIIAAIEKPSDRSMIPEGAELLTVPQVARMLDWGESVLRQRDRQGLLPAPLRFGGTIQWRKKELLAWMDAGCPPRQKWELLKRGKEA